MPSLHPSLQGGGRENRPVEQRNPKLLDQVRGVVRARHYSLRTEEAYVRWMRRFIVFHGNRHPREMGVQEVQQFLTHLAVEGRVAASTQSQALSAILFLSAASRPQTGLAAGGADRCPKG